MNEIDSLPLTMPRLLAWAAARAPERIALEEAGLQLDYAAEYDVVRVDAVGDEYLLHLKAKNRAVAYDQLKIRADKSRKLPTKIECLTEAGMLIKTLYFKQVKDLGGGIVRPSYIETDSPLYKGYKSVMIYAKIRKREFRDEVFTLTFMPNIGSLR